MEGYLDNRLRQVRKDAGLTQAELAERLGVSRKTINTIENKVFFPSAHLALLIAKHFEKSVEEIFWVTDK